MSDNDDIEEFEQFVVKSEEEEIEERRRRREEIKRKYEKDLENEAKRVKVASDISVGENMGIASSGDIQIVHDNMLKSEEVLSKEEVIGDSKIIKEVSNEEKGFDIFSLSPIKEIPGLFDPKRDLATGNIGAIDNPLLHMEHDDIEGYYKARVGEIIDNQYRVMGVIGKGVFSTVLKCVDTNDESGSIVAIKLIRANDLMRKAADKEATILSQLSKNDVEHKKHCVVMKSRLEYRNHIGFVFEHQSMNLRETIKKFGKGIGISVSAVRLYARQLCIALKHMQDLKIIHADIKPDNILLSDDLMDVKICDFGSAFFIDDYDNKPTPYLVSRFYRAPEIILGLQYDYAIDIWSIGTVLYEIFTGQLLFPGRNNNDMLRLMMLTMGKVPNKIIRSHFKAYSLLEKEPHFNEDMKFKQYDFDSVTERVVMKLVDFIHPPTGLSQSILSAKAGSDDKSVVLQLIDLLEKAFVLDPAKRINVMEALRHPLFAPPGTTTASGSNSK